MALLLYGFSCDMLGDVLDVKPERGIFSTRAITASFSVFVAYLLWDWRSKMEKS